MPREFSKHICLEENFVYLNGKKHALSESVRNNFQLYQKRWKKLQQPTRQLVSI